MVGLAEAAERYDSSRGEPFVAFATKRVRGAVLDELRRGDPLSRSARRSARQLGETMRTLEQRLGRPPEDHEVAAALGIDVEEYQDELAMLTHISTVGLEVAESAAGGAHRRRRPVAGRRARAGPDAGEPDPCAQVAGPARRADPFALLQRGVHLRRDRRAPGRDRVARVPAARARAGPAARGGREQGGQEWVAASTSRPPARWRRTPPSTWRPTTSPTRSTDRLQGPARVIRRGPGQHPLGGRRLHRRGRHVQRRLGRRAAPHRQPARPGPDGRRLLRGQHAGRRALHAGRRLPPRRRGPPGQRRRPCRARRRRHRDPPAARRQPTSA